MPSGVYCLRVSPGSPPRSPIQQQEEDRRRRMEHAGGLDRTKHCHVRQTVTATGAAVYPAGPARRTPLGSDLGGISGVAAAIIIDHRSPRSALRPLALPSPALSPFSPRPGHTIHLANQKLCEKNRLRNTFVVGVPHALDYSRARSFVSRERVANSRTPPFFRGVTRLIRSGRLRFVG